MKWNVQLLVVGTAVILPAAALCFPGATKKQKDETPSSTKTEPAVMPPLGMKQDKEPVGPTHSGKVLESMNGAGYTYILLEKKGGDKHWFAIPETSVKVGQDLEVMQGMEMGKFTSKALNRTFDSINFSGGIVVREDDEAVKKKAHAGLVSSTDNSAEAAAKVEKAKGDNAYTVEEIYARKGELTGKSVLVKGKVVKVSSGILGKNWIHLRDGSGSAATGNHNLVVTTQETPAVGDIVTVSGEFFRDREFGSGYKYDVILENGAIRK